MGGEGGDEYIAGYIAPYGLETEPCTPSTPSPTPPTPPTPPVITVAEAVEVLEEAEAARGKFTVWQVYCNDDGDYEFIFINPHKDNNWLTIYDKYDNIVHREDISYSNPRTVVSLPNGTYMVKTFHSEGHIIQEFMVGPCAVEALPYTGSDSIFKIIGGSLVLLGLGLGLYLFSTKRRFKVIGK